MKLRKVLALSGALAATLIGATESPAAAVTNYREYASVAGSAPPSGSSCSQVYYGGGLAGVACYQALGDVFWIRDTMADGHGRPRCGQSQPIMWRPAGSWRVSTAASAATRTAGRTSAGRSAPASPT